MRMRSVVPMRAAKTGYLILSTALCALGIVLIVLPDLSAKVIGLLCGILLLLFGCIRLVGYFSKDLYRLAFQYDLVFGILSIVLGIAILIRPESLMTFVCIALGLSILTDGLFKIQIAWQAKNFGIRSWWLILSCAILASLCGVVLMFRPGAGSNVLMILMGITFLSEGILNFCTMLTAVKIVRYQMPDVIDVDVFERK